MKHSARVNVIVPSYRRPNILANCLTALCAQEFREFSALCVCRPTDSETRNVVASFAAQDARFSEVLVEEPGLAAALNAGLRVATAEYVGFTDDDAEAPTHWLATIVRHFEHHPECGAVGGPDRLQLPDAPTLANPPPAKRVGVYSWFGRMAATHHHPITELYLRCIALKGVNMSFRRDFVGNVIVGDGLRGKQCAHCTEASLCGAVIAHGAEIHFVRDAWVLHYCAPRAQNDDRLDPFSVYALDNSFNYAYVLWRYQPMLTALRAQLWGLVVGSRNRPGILRSLNNTKQASSAPRHWLAMVRGLLRGLADRSK
jgi:GT2 family glycosyltransferase